ncbi:ABC transporter ATP-binding protein [Gordonia insulae]|uniref:Putative ABC transporter ATP-binding protein YbhF n=1 Tax=Gordonia insulae TaxID=2420509 RepID=A0A3G8JVJ4_9ACTN|nr:ABC transporter ATP-binding protein [Gordonia insulae]AZG48629.1 putative ABC transporter ATP-binding protein YbhF [Gordonia insulae]
MALVATGLTRSFGRHTAVAHADVTLRPGRITGLVGPNGAGKTTLLLILAGLLAPDAGSVEVDGGPIAASDLRARVGWMPDVFGTWESLSTTEILTTFARLHGASAADARRRAHDLLQLVHLGEFADKPAHELSRGQKQRLGFARALVNRPSILLLDEPASGMDPRSRIDLRDQVRELAADGCAILVSSHILTELSEMVDDVVMMTAGRTFVPEHRSGHLWRIRLAGQSVADAEATTFPDDDSAAEYLAGLIATGVRVSEFTRVTNELEDTYLALDAERT